MKRRDLIAGTLALSLSGPAALGERLQAGRRKWALLVGPTTGPTLSSALRGSSNDVRAVHNVLGARYGVEPKNVRALVGPQADQKSVQAGLEWLARNAGPDDTVLVYFTGYGTTCPTAGGGREGALCPQDAVFDPKAAPTERRLIAFSTLDAWEKRVPTRDVTVVVDVALAGLSEAGAADGDALPLTPIAQPTEETTRLFAALTARSGATVGRVSPSRAVKERPLLAGGGGKASGAVISAFTYFLTDELREAGNAPANGDAVARLDAELRGQLGPVSRAAHVGTNQPKRAFFSAPGGKSDRKVAARVASLKGDDVELATLAGARLAPGSLLVGDAPAGGEPGVVKVAHVDGLNAKGKRIKGAVAPGEIVRLAGQPLPDTPRPLRAAVVGKDTGGLSDALRGKADVTVVPAASGDADVTVVPVTAGDGKEKTFTVFNGDFPLPVVTESQLPSCLGAIRATRRLAQLENPAAPIRVSVTSAGETAYRDVTVGDAITFDVLCDHDAYLLVLSLSADGVITGLPNRPRPKLFTVTANQPFKFGPMRVTDPVGLEVIKIVALTYRPDFLLPANARDAETFGATPDEIAGAILKLLRQNTNARDDAASPTGRLVRDLDGTITTDHWGVAQFLLRVHGAKPT
jgi:hypothetical protein